MHLEEEKEELKISSNPPFYPKKMILKHGIKHFLLDTNDVVYCYSNNKVVYIVDACRQKYLYDKNLLRLETELDPKQFFKANRTHLINFHYIRSFITHEKNKIKVELKTGEAIETVIISQTRVNAFREWIYKQL